MPATLTYPGVYVEEISSGVRTIVGVGTSIAAFIGRAARGPLNRPVVINSFGDFDRQFGGVWAESTLGYAVRDFFLNGGSQAVIVRLFNPPKIVAGDLADEHAQAVARATEAGGGIVGEVEAAAAAIEAGVETLPAALSEIFARHRENGGVEGAMADRLEAELKRLVDMDGVEPDVDVLLTLLEGMHLDDEADDEATAQNGVVEAAIMAGEQPGADLLDIMRAARNAAPPGAALAVQTAAASRADDIARAATTNASMPADAVIQRLRDAVPDAAQSVADELVPVAAEAVLEAHDLVLKAASPGTWGNSLRFRVDHEVDEQAAADNGYASADALFNLTVRDLQSGQTEVFRNVAANGSRELKAVLASASELVRCDDNPAGRPAEHARAGKFDKDDDDYSSGVTTKGGDGDALDDAVVRGEEGYKTGLYALEDADLFNLLCIPPYSRPGADAAQPGVGVLSAAADYCQRRRAMLIVDPPLRATKEEMLAKVDDLRGGVTSTKANVALFYPSLRATSSTGRLEDFAPCGAIAGTFARTDTTRGVWKAPAGIEAGISGSSGLTTALTDAENGMLNPRAINCLRNMPAGRVIWGARTLAGDDRTPNDWKYIPVRRTALYIEESLYRGTQWVVFEPNDEPLWAQIRLSVGAFMNDMFRQRAFQGQTPREAYYVKCDKETNPQNEINKGVVNIHVGFAPLKPAEFVVIKLQQIAGEILT